MLLRPLVDDLPNIGVKTQPVAAVSVRSAWCRGITLAGTVNSIAAAAETLTPNAIYAAALAAANNVIGSYKCIQVPPCSTYLELGASGDGNAIGTAPVIELYRSCHPNTAQGLVASSITPPVGGCAAGVGVAIPAGEEDWERLYSVLGNAQTTFGVGVNDVTGAAGAARYSLDEGTYQNRLFDVRGSRLIVVRVVTIGTSNNWFLRFRFF